MFNKFKRTNFLTEVSSQRRVYEYDLLSMNWDLFQINHTIQYDNIKATDINRPDLLSYRIYGDSQYWWILCKFNNIDDIWNDMYIGGDLVIPSLADIEDYYARVKKRTIA